MFSPTFPASPRASVPGGRFVGLLRGHRGVIQGANLWHHAQDVGASATRQMMVNSG